MAYTTELSLRSSSTLRRISWALGVPMTQGIESVFDYLPRFLDRSKVCTACRDRSRCSDCVFNFKTSFRLCCNQIAIDFADNGELRLSRFCSAVPKRNAQTGIGFCKSAGFRDCRPGRTLRKMFPFLMKDRIYSLSVILGPEKG